MYSAALLLISQLLLAQAQQPQQAPGSGGDNPVYSGTSGELTVNMPRLEDPEVAIDGDLSEAAWSEAAVLTDFTQFQPVEGAPASERTEVLLFYTPESLYVGVRAYASNRGAVRATLADRDNIGGDDRFEIYLDTFLDRRRAYAFQVNPLGIQRDGIYDETAGGRNRFDFSPDFNFDSRGRLTDYGYEVEIRIPLKGLRFDRGEPKSWGLNVVREIAATGAKETWAPIRRGPSQLEQSGTLVGIRDLRPGRLLEVAPVLTGSSAGERVDGEFRRDSFDPDFGANLKYGVTSNLTLDLTYNPDFSQVEADAGQITTNERFAIFFDEKRPFFLEGAEIFRTPEQLVYTRSIVDPTVGAKLTGRAGPFSVGYLGALDESPLRNSGLAPDPGRALFNILRVQRDVGSGSNVGALVTDREVAGQFNRVLGVDGSFRFADLYSLGFQLAGSWTKSWVADSLGTDTVRVRDVPIAVGTHEDAGHLLKVGLDRTGRRWGFFTQIRDIPESFHARSGFIRRTSVSELFAVTRHTFFGQQGALLQSSDQRLSWNRTYTGRDLWNGGDPEEGDFGASLDFQLRGNNSIDLSYGRRFFVLDPLRLADFVFFDESGRPIPGDQLVRPFAEMRGLDQLSVEARSSYFSAVSANAELRWAETPIFAEGTRGESWTAELGMSLRPTDAIRIRGDFEYQRLHRASNGSLYSEAFVPRIRAEYQVSRAIFVRAIGQYTVQEVDLLRTPTGEPLLFEGQPVRIRDGRQPFDQPQLNPLRVDLLFSYRPSPGTVVFLGYGREMNDNEAFRFSPLEPRSDGLFVKVSYLFRN